MAPRSLFAVMLLLVLACSRPVSVPSLASPSQPYDCRAPAPGKGEPAPTMTLAATPGEEPKQPYLPSDLLAQRDELASCLEPGEEVQLVSRGGQLTPLCQAARSESLTCLRERFAPLAGAAAEKPFTLRAESPSPDRNEQFQATIREHMHEFQDCYHGILTVRPDAQGVIVLAFFVGATGTVEGTDLVHNGTGSPELAC